MKFITALYKTYEPENWLSLDDVLLLPQKSPFDSRNSPAINIASKITSNIGIKVPVCSANMDTVTEKATAIAMYKKGGMGILHRFYGDARRDEYFSHINDILNETGQVAISIGCAKSDLDVVRTVVEMAQGRPVVVCVDVAHGHMDQAIRQIREVSKTFGAAVQIIGGNYASPQAVVEAIKAGANAVKVSVGSGSLCTTRLITGHGTPLATLIMQCRRALMGVQSNAALIADGGIRDSGDIIKCLALGADAVMVGRLFAGTVEAPGKEILIDEKLHKQYRGQSSRSFLNDLGKKGVTAEGESMLVPVNGTIGDAMDTLVGGIRSGMTYSGAKDLVDLYEKSIFMEISRATYVEGTPHGLQYARSS